MEIIETGLYMVSDDFFINFPDKFLKGNKDENRPHYCAIKDKKTGLFWMIPLSSKIEKYQAIIDRRTASGAKCDILHISKLDNGKKSAFLIQDMFPVLPKYVLREYSLAGKHFRITSENEIKIIRSKAMRVLNMIRRGVKFSFNQPDVLAIEKQLLEKDIA